MSEELEILKDVAAKLNASGIPYMVSGSVAMNFCATPRMTRDIDVVVEMQRGDIDRFVDLFGRDYYLEADAIRDEVARRGMFNLIHQRSIIKVDFVLQKTGAYDRVAFERRRQVDVDGTGLWLISPEDLVVRKLLWGRDGESELQLRDVANILTMADALDHAYIDRWIREFALEPWLERAKRGRRDA
jgi:hypothetical protein